jgi:glycolate oxidase FAD binding subunit
MGAIAQTLESIVDAAHITACEALAEPWLGRLQGAIGTASWPECIVYPQTVEQLAAVVACAHKHHWRLIPCGHGSKLDWGGLVNSADLVVSTAQLNQVIEHAEGDLTVTAQAGVGFADMQTALQQTRQFLAIDPAYPDLATLGGLVATRDTGALRQRYGGIRDLLIGIEFVRHDGQLAKAGGRVVKNVAGYDLMKLMTGSFGTLGIITQLTLRTYPQSETSQTVLLKGDSSTLKRVTADILRSPLTPIALDILSSGLLTAPQPDQTGLALRFQSIEAGVTEQVERLQAIVQPYALSTQVLTDEADAQFWPTINRQLFDATATNAAIAKLGILPAKAVDLLDFLAATLPPESWQARIHASSGIGTLRLQTVPTSLDTLPSVRSYCQTASGYFNLLTAPNAWKVAFDPWGIHPSTRMLMSRLRAQFDPQDRLSPGRMM